MSVSARVLGTPVDRLEGRDKVQGKARYAYEYPLDRLAYGTLLVATVAKGRIRSIDARDALAAEGVLAVLTWESAPKLPKAEGELAVLQGDRVSYRGQIVGVVIAESYEAARHAERLVRVDYDVEQHDVTLRADHPTLYRPDKVNPSFPTDTEEGDVERALREAAHAIDLTYTTPAYHNNAMEPHATTAFWQEGRLTLYDSNQGAYAYSETIAQTFDIPRERVRVIARHVGGGFGSKGTPRPHVIATALAAHHVLRPVKLAVTRQQMFALTGYRTPTIQRLQLGCDADGKLTAIAHDVVEQTSTVDEFAEQTAVVTRMLYASPNRRTTHRLARLDVPTPSWMRAPGECPGMYALESAIDELARAAGIDPVDLRVRNDPEIDPESGHRFSTRNLVACLREGAERFGWSPGGRREGRTLVGMGVAASTYPARRRPSQASARREDDGTFTVRVGAVDIGTGARTVLAQVAADALEVPLEQVRIEIGDSDFGQAPVAGGSAGTSSWGAAVVKACRTLRVSGEDEVHVETGQADEPLAKHGFGAQFVEVRVDVDTAEIRVARAFGLFACGRILNPKTARSQFVGGMTMGLGMALLEESRVDAQFGGFVNHDLAQYHVPVNADVAELDADWLDEEDPHVNPMGAKGIGEIGIVGTAAAVANAVFDATGVRVRDLPITPERLLPLLRK
ncbi:MAG TPA: xanthine dehydrogenase family protein molybdopterin-binding subunit [Gaiellaceae bacterium]|nr:xanthine dehydrogenase family protein molybdopterin-binding subunit [Gaiellaceae bacterium]